LGTQNLLINENNMGAVIDKTVHSAHTRWAPAWVTWLTVVKT